MVDIEDDKWEAWQLDPKLISAACPVSTFVYSHLKECDIEDSIRLLDSNFTANLGRFTASEFVFISYQRDRFRRRALRKQAIIQQDLAQAKGARDFHRVNQCLLELQALNRKCWNFASVIKQKVLVRRKGTERSRSKSGSQAICTHTLAIFSCDTLARWLIGLLAILDASNDALRNTVIEKVPTRHATRRYSGIPSFNPSAA